MEDLININLGLPKETVRHYNNELVRLFSMTLNLLPNAVEPQMVEELAAECRISRAEAFAQCVAALAGYDAGGKDRIFFQYWLLPAVQELQKEQYLADAYFKNVKIPPQKCGKWELKQEKLHPYEPFVCRDFIVTKDKRLIPQIGFFKEEYPFPAVLENGREWMTLQPNEMVTTRPAIEKAHDRVLTYGLGLGYFAYHAAEKEEVESVTVVDISEDVIELFQKNILPQFPHKEKIKLIKADAFEFAQTRMQGNFDFVFGDIWHDAGDGRDLYLKMKAWEKKYPEIEFSFWLEETICCYLDESLW